MLPNKFQSIKAKIILIYTVLTIALTSALLFTMYIKEKDNVLNIRLQHTADVSKMHAQLLSQEFSQIVAMLKMVSLDPVVRAGNVDYISRAIHRLVTLGKGNFLNAIYVDKELNLIDTKGFSGKVTHPNFMKDEQWKGKEYNVTSPIKSRFEKELVTMVAVPIRDDNGNWAGTLAVAVALDTLSERLASIKLANGSFAWLADSNGDLISHPNKDFILKINVADAEKFGFFGFDSVLEKVKTQAHGYGRYWDDNIKESKVVKFSKVEFVPGWVLYVTTIESEVFSDIYNILYSLLFVALVITVIFIVVLRNLAHKVTAPISKLTEEVVASAINPTQSITIINSKDEIGYLSRVFSKSLKRIHVHTTQLEALVKKRTEELEDKNIVLASQNAQLEELASKDPLTHLYNRRAFNLYIDKEIARVARYGGTMSLAIIDLDHFKQVNDSHGHDVGDMVLCNMADFIMSHTRKANIVCRWGGEEFVILIPEATSEMGKAHLENLRNDIACVDFAPVSKLTFSAGVSEYRAGEPVKAWIQRVDHALYRAKDLGRDRVIIA